MKKIYPRTGDTQTVYLNAVVKDPSIWATILSIMISCPTRYFSSGTMYFTITLSTTNG